MKKCIVTYAEGAHEELLEVSEPAFKNFAQRHGYEFRIGDKMLDSWNAAWNKIPLLLNALEQYEEVVWFDCDLVITDAHEDFPAMASDMQGGVSLSKDASHALVRHFECDSEVPNSGVWRLRRGAAPLLHKALELEVFRDHGWWEQAALMALMGYTVPPQGSEFPKTKCRCVRPTYWYEQCYFMRLAWNSHPNYRAERPRIVHCSYPNMIQRLEVMRALVKDPTYDYPRYDVKDSTKLAAEAALKHLEELTYAFSLGDETDGVIRQLRKALSVEETKE
jgi:hypothetical protein